MSLQPQNWQRTHTLTLVIRMSRVLLLALQSQLALGHQPLVPSLSPELQGAVVLILQILVETLLTIISSPQSPSTTS